ncbi:MAG: TetR/AcrR family transcriptional regulator [Congregibacter sp.]
MGRQPKHRDAILSAAIMLFRERGYSATGVADILSASGAPKGSLYHYFPGGKEAVAAASVRLAGEVVTATLVQLAQQSDSGGEFLRAYTALLGLWLEQSDFRQGCPIATTLLETSPHSPEITLAGDEALGAWRDVITDVLLRRPETEGNAAALSTLCISAIEGALLMARVSQSCEPLGSVCEQLCRLFEHG